MRCRRAGALSEARGGTADRALGSIVGVEMRNGHSAGVQKLLERRAPSDPLRRSSAHPPENTVLVLVRSLTTLRLSSAAYLSCHK